jgi:hypothetical protein
LFSFNLGGANAASSGRGRRAVGRHRDGERAGQCSGDLASQGAAVVNAVDSSGGAGQRTARLPPPADGAQQLAEPQRRVELHGAFRTERLDRTASRYRIWRAHPRPLPDRVRAVGHPTPRRSNVVPQGLQAAQCLARAARVVALRRGRPDRDRMAERRTGRLSRHSAPTSPRPCGPDRCRS